MGGLYGRSPTNNASQRVAAAASRVGRTGPSSLCAAGVESCSSTPTCPGPGVAVPSLAELVSRGKSLHLTSRGQRPAGTRTFPDLECGLLAGCRVVPEERSISSPCLLTCTAGPLLSSGQGWIPGQAEWNRCSPCSEEECRARRQAAQPAPSQQRPEPGMLKASGARPRLHLWAWTLNTQQPAGCQTEWSTLWTFTQPGESDFGIIRFPQMRNPATERARNSLRSHKEQAEGEACHLSHCPSCQDLG